jgi:signal transduction histidine kinase
MPLNVSGLVDLAGSRMAAWIGDAMITLVRAEDRIIRVMGPSPKDANIAIEVVIDEAPLRGEMVSFAWRILALSIAISLITATLRYVSLHLLLVQPMRKITENMVLFHEDPEDANRVMQPSESRDEISVAQRELAGMQQRLRVALRQKEHLAALGTAVAKINHDLRGILSPALLISDRLEDSDDPEVKRVMPRLVAAIERAVSLCSQTMGYVRRGAPEVLKERFSLASLVTDIGFDIADLNGWQINVESRVGMDFEVTGSRGLMFLVFSNLARNAVEAGADTISIVACETVDGIKIKITDDGSGLPQRAQDNLFKPLEGSARAGGVGLGLTSVGELARSHGGDLSLVSTGDTGTVFMVTIPARWNSARNSDKHVVSHTREIDS